MEYFISELIKLLEEYLRNNNKEDDKEKKE